MDIETIQKLRQLDEAFYRDNAASFASTRLHAWPGWERVVAALSSCPATVLDMACGNARFMTFVDERFETTNLRFYGVDSCLELLPADQALEFQELDIIGALIEDGLSELLEAPACDLTVCFGFMHHVPTNELRTRLLDALIGKTVQGGTLAVSFWQFANDPKTLKKALESTKRGSAELDLTLEEGDFLLGWNDVPGTYRYCHSFAEDELDGFIRHCEDRAVLVDRFGADGRTGEMNGYLIFRRL